MTLYARFIRIAAFCGLACVFMSCGSSLSTTALAATATPAVSLSASSVSLGGFPVGTTSGSTYLVLSNSGNDTLWISGVALTGSNPGDFALNNGCSSSVAAGANCSISFTFTPSAAGTRTASINISDNAPGSAQYGLQTVTISGTGEGAATANLSASSLTFGSQATGTASTAQNLTLTNSGNASLSISSIWLGGASPSDFAQSNNCGSSLAGGSSCTISVTFKPAAAGTFTAALGVTDNASGGSQSVALSGTGGGSSSPAVSLSATSLSLGAFSVGTTSGSTSLVMTNSGGGTLWISGVTLTGSNPGDFALNNGCASSLAAGANCVIAFTFTPTAAGTRTASININDNAPGATQYGLQTVTISGTGGAAAATLSTGGLTFASQAMGTASAAQYLTLTNGGNASLSISSIGLAGANPGDFAQSNNCGSSLAAGSSCTLSVIFKPAASGAFKAALALTDNASGGSQSVTLTGTGSGTTASPAVTVSLSATSLAFGNQATDTTSSLQTVTLSNTGSTALTISGLAVTGTNAGDFTQNDNCGTSLAAGANCTIGILFTPSASGSATASLQVTDNGNGSPQTVALAGTGTHDVVLAWAAVTSASGYNVFRGTWSGGESSTPLNSSPVNGTSYTDASVSAGVTYYYVLKAVSENGAESAASNEMSAVVP